MNSIRLLGSSNNKRGDLFTRLTKDLFFALGYDNLRLDVHKSGRELDLIGEHRFEPRHIVAECKAHADKMGGAELNKFYGVLTRERKKYFPAAVAGYFVSLGGFTETAIEQELETGEDALILLDAQTVIKELVRSNVVVGNDTATERAGHLAEYAGIQNSTLKGIELLGHESGYLWAVFYEYGKKRTHFALIHADGRPLDASIVRDVIDVDKQCGGSLHSLKYLAPPAAEFERLTLASRVTDNYRQWLGEECGYIYLDGMPADTNLSVTRLKLERLFVPLKCTFLPNPDDSPEVQQDLIDAVFSVGEMMERAPHLAILAAPGGGKSTLLKRLATAYAFAERRTEISDNLPQREWMPLFLRCRELRDRAHRPIIELLDDIPRHAGMSADESAIFQHSVHTALHAGNALLLIDGLDEISDEGARQTFASHLRTFVAMFPQAALVVTSREAGFRLVGGVIASACQQAKLAPLDEQDVLTMCERWHVEVVGGSEKVRAEAKELGVSIWENERIRKLAENPLLLTTLLVVRRWIGELPRSRAALYREAIRVLVRTWNVEGFAPLDEDETLAQLSYVACAMMEEGKQQIGRQALLKLLRSARRELEAELQFARISPQEFIDRIEYRSSLLMQIGQERVEGTLQPVYEFRHLTFQEYLAARGFVEEQYPGRDSGRSLADVLEPHFGDERWDEVIPLAAVLAGRKADVLINRLGGACKKFELRLVDQQLRDPIVALEQCIRDEVQLAAPTLRRALLLLGATAGVRRAAGGGVTEILKGKFGGIFQEVVQDAYFSSSNNFEEYLGTLSEIAVYSYFKDKPLSGSDEILSSLLQVIESGNRIERVHAVLVSTLLAYNTVYGGLEPQKTALQDYFESIIKHLTTMLTITDLPCAVAASWAFAWIGESRIVPTPPQPQLLLSLYKLWRQIESDEQARFPAWALSTQRLLPRDSFGPDVWGNCDEFLLKSKVGSMQEAAHVVGWYRRSPWTDTELAELIGKGLSGRKDQTTRDLLDNLGQAGEEAIKNYQNLIAPKRQARQHRGRRHIK